MVDLMEDNVIETSIDRLIQILKQKNKMNISEAADFLKMTQKEVEPILNILEENGIIEIKYPVIGEPKVVLKTTAPEKIEIKPEIKEAYKKTENRIEDIERSKIKDRIGNTEINEEEVKEISNKVEKLENKITDISNEVDASTFKEELSEILLIIAGLKNIDKISFYLKEVLGLVHKMKEKGIWAEEDKDLTATMLNDISENWKEYGENEISELFQSIKKKIETA